MPANPKEDSNIGSKYINNCSSNGYVQVTIEFLYLPVINETTKPIKIHDMVPTADIHIKDIRNNGKTPGL